MELVGAIGSCSKFPKEKRKRKITMGSRQVSSVVWDEFFVVSNKKLPEKVH